MHGLLVGAREAYGEVIAFSEADLAYPLQQLGDAIAMVQSFSADLAVCASGVYWPTQNDPAFARVNDDAATSSDHRLVWVDIALPGARCP